ncbi:putative ribonuclease H-like domain-containing protein [Tanacetum coccineum]
MVPKAVIMKSALVSVNIARQVNTAHTKTTVNGASPMSNLSKIAHSTVKRPINKNTTFKNSNKRDNTVRGNNVNTARPKAVVNAVKGNNVNAVNASACWGNLQQYLQEKGLIDSGYSRHMTGNMSYLTDFKEIDGGYIAFEGNLKVGKITGKCIIKTGNLDFKNVYFVRELKFNLFSVSQMCDKKNSVLFNDTECIVLSPNFKLTDESHVLLKVPRKHNMYSVDLKNIVPKGGLTCLFAKATSDESKLWHRRLGHINFKTMNKLVKGNLVRGLPSKLFENNKTCVACKKGKQHRASCKSKTVSLINQPLHMLHIDLFGPTFVKSLMKKMYCLVVTDDYSRFSWVFFLATKDETSGILKSFITGVENLIDQRVKVIRCDNGTEFKNKEMNQFCERKGIKREFSVARTPQQNGVAERKNRTLIEDARTMLADSKLPTTFWAEAVNTACYVQNRVLVTKPHNKTPYELFLGRKPALGFMRPFGCPVTILNTIDHLGKFDGKADEGFFVGYSINRSGPNWLFDINALTKSMNYKPVFAGKQFNWTVIHHSLQSSKRVLLMMESKPSMYYEKKLMPNKPDLEDIVYSDDDEDVGAEADMNNLNAFMPVSPIPTTRIHKDHPEDSKKVIHALKDPSWIEAMQEELLQFKLQEVWTLVDLPNRKRAIGTKWIFRNKKDERGIVIKNKARLVASRKKDGIFISQDKYVGEILKKFGYTEVKTASTPMETQKPLLKDEDGEKVVVYMYRYLKGQPKLGLWYPKDSPFDLVAYTDSDYAGASLDRKSTTGGCQFLESRLISWQCKKQTTVANSTTEAEYVAASSCRGQVL